MQFTDILVAPAGCTPYENVQLVAGQLTVNADCHGTFILSGIEQIGEQCTCKDGIMQCTGDVASQASCRADQVYFSCDNIFETGAERGRTCLNRHLPYASIKCQAGCACAPGLVDDGTACVAPEQCPCYYQNHRYSPNSQVTRDCNTCVCQGGYWQCTDYLCNAECSLIGQSHLITFDDLQVEFDGDCRYVLATNEEHGFQTRLLIG